VRAWLKCWPENFDAIVEGRKKAEIRDTADRDFRVGDLLELVRWDPQRRRPTGNSAIVRVCHVELKAGPLHVMGVQLIGDGYDAGRITRMAVLSIDFLELRDFAYPSEDEPTPTEAPA